MTCHDRHAITGIRHGVSSRSSRGCTSCHMRVIPQHFTTLFMKTEGCATSATPPPVIEEDLVDDHGHASCMVGHDAPGKSLLTTIMHVKSVVQVLPWQGLLHKAFTPTTTTTSCTSLLASIHLAPPLLLLPLTHTHYKAHHPNPKHMHVVSHPLLQSYVAMQ